MEKFHPRKTKSVPTRQNIFQRRGKKKNMTNYDELFPEVWRYVEALSQPSHARTLTMLDAAIERVNALVAPTAGDAVRDASTYGSPSEPEFWGDVKAALRGIRPWQPLDAALSEGEEGAADEDEAVVYVTSTGRSHAGDYSSFHEVTVSVPGSLVGEALPIVMDALTGKK